MPQTHEKNKRLCGEAGFSRGGNAVRLPGTRSRTEPRRMSRPSPGSVILRTVGAILRRNPDRTKLKTEIELDIEIEIWHPKGMGASSGPRMVRL